MQWKKMLKTKVALLYKGYSEDSWNIEIAGNFKNKINCIWQIIRYKTCDKRKKYFQLKIFFPPSWSISLYSKIPVLEHLTHGCHGSGKSQGKNKFFKVREKSGNSDFVQGKWKSWKKSGKSDLGQGKLGFFEHNELSLAMTTCWFNEM